MNYKLTIKEEIKKGEAVWRGEYSYIGDNVAIKSGCYK